MCVCVCAGKDCLNSGTLEERKYSNAVDWAHAVLLTLLVYVWFSASY